MVMLVQVQKWLDLNAYVMLLNLIWMIYVSVLLEHFDHSSRPIDDAVRLH